VKADFETNAGYAPKLSLQEIPQRKKLDMQGFTRSDCQAEELLFQIAHQVARQIARQCVHERNLTVRAR